jgi:hypothetical protein
MGVSKIEQYRRVDGTFPRYSSVGCYSVLYVTADGDCLCADCVNEEAQHEDDPSWEVECADIHWEGPSLRCGHCGEEIESSYGDPAEEGEA